MIVLRVDAPLDALRDEARVREADAFESRTAGIWLDPVLGILRGPRRHRQASGPRLQAWHEGELLDCCAGALGCELLPTRSTYLYLDDGSRIALHQDVDACRWTAIVGLDGEAPTLRLAGPAAPEAGPPLLDYSLACDGFPARGEDHGLHPGQALLFEGRRRPHAVLPVVRAATIATLCFTTLAVAA